MLGLYIHVPFCAQKCNYCDFNSYKIEEKNQKRDYLISIKKEMELYKEEFRNKEFTSVFLGGGAPSILTSDELTNLMDNIYSNFIIKKDAEITIECNPGTINKEKLETIIIKDLDVAITVSPIFEDKEKIDFNQFINKDNIAKYEEEIKFDKKVFNELIAYGIENLKIAKAKHDIIEAYYVPNMRFDEVGKLKDELINRILKYENK